MYGDLFCFIALIQFDIVKHMRQDQITHGLVHAITSVMHVECSFWFMNSFTLVKIGNAGQFGI